MSPKNKKKPNGYWTDSRLKNQAALYLSRDKFRKGNPSAYVIAFRRGKEFLDKICSHMPKHVDQSGENNPFFKWTFEMLREEALKYLTREDFKRGSSKAYTVAVKRSDYDKICSHMPSPKNEAYTDKEFRELAIKYNTIRDFAEYCPGAYGSLKNNGRLAEFCSHMKRASGSSGAEKEILAAIKTFFPNSQKIRHTGLSIIDRPYIHAFEIDIFVSDLMKGIEFDGRRYHSFNHMRKDKSKNKWPDEAILNYHTIKDSYFTSKGIQLLHIKEQDWMDNKSTCITQIEQFLGITGFMSDMEYKAA